MDFIQNKTKKTGWNSSRSTQNNIKKVEESCFSIEVILIIIGILSVSVIVGASEASGE